MKKRIERELDAKTSRMEIELEIARGDFEESGNPHYAWKAIDFCIKNDLSVGPSWLTAYLAQCSERMLSDKAAQTTDLRKTLPWVLGFPQGRGPGKLLHPYRSWEQIHFAIEFAYNVLKGQDPVIARREACNAAFDGKAAGADDKTLTRWLLKSFDLEKAPKNAEQWREVAEEYLLGCAARYVVDHLSEPTDAVAQRIIHLMENHLSGQSLARL
jgi:hypothetical protein